MKQIKIKTNDINQRLDNFIKKTFINLSKIYIQKAIREKKIKVNDKKSINNYRLQINDVISLYINDDLLLNKNNKNDFLLCTKNPDIVYEDKNIVIANKPIGMSVHDDESKTINTFINMMIKYLYQKKEYDPKNENSFTPSLVHRIDKNTKGLVMVAKNALSLKILNEKIKNHEINKYYLAKVHKHISPENNTISAFLTKNTNTKIVKISAKQLNNESCKIITVYRFIKYIKEEDASLIEVQLITGKTHQIRAHFNYIGFPLVGEKKYTTSQYSNDTKKCQALISYKIIFNFTTPSNILAYLNKKTIELKNTEF